MEKEQRLKELLKTKDLLSSGYAGVDSYGTIVDRRENPSAVPIQKNSMFDTPEPKPLEPTKSRQQ